MFVHKTGFTKHRLLNKISYILLFQSRLWFCVYLALHIAEKFFRHIFFTCKKKYDLSILKTLVLISIWIHMSYATNLNKIYMYRVRTALLIIFCNISTFFGMRELTSTGIYYLKIKCNNYWLPHKNLKKIFKKTIYYFFKFKYFYSFVEVRNPMRHPILLSQIALHTCFIFNNVHTLFCNSFWEFFFFKTIKGCEKCYCKILIWKWNIIT